MKKIILILTFFFSILGYAQVDTTDVDNIETDSSFSNAAFTSDKSQIKAYPNPIKSGQTLTVKLNSLTANVELFSVLGRLVYSDSVSGLDRKEINTSDFKHGLYLLSVKTDDFTVTRRIVITK